MSIFVQTGSSNSFTYILSFGVSVGYIYRLVWYVGYAKVDETKYNADY